MRSAALRRTAALAIGLAIAVAAVQASAEEKRLSLAAPVSYVDTAGNTVTTADFPGRFLLVYFGYTHCADQCPTALSAMVEALAEIGPAADHIQPLFVTVDPERDKGEALGRFAAAFDKRLVALIGSPDQIAAAAKAFGIDYRKVLAGSDDYLVDHSALFSIVGPERDQVLTFAVAEPYQIAAKLLELLDRGGLSLRGVNNQRAYR